jgi:predicted HicB family RNase H-like nuclease
MRTDKPGVESFVRKTEVLPPKEIEYDQGQGEKTFLLRFPKELWYELKMEALQEGKTLHEYILHILRTRKG